MRRLLPPDVCTSTRAALATYAASSGHDLSHSAAASSAEPHIVVSKRLVSRLWYRRALWFTRMTKASIARLHKTDLNTTYSTQGLDITEMCAVYNSPVQNPFRV